MTWEWNLAIAIWALSLAGMGAWNWFLWRDNQRKAETIEMMRRRMW